jgi:hypothetical protein
LCRSKEVFSSITRYSDLKIMDYLVAIIPLSMHGGSIFPTPTREQQSLKSLLRRNSDLLVMGPMAVRGSANGFSAARRCMCCAGWGCGPDRAVIDVACNAVFRRPRMSYVRRTLGLAFFRCLWTLRQFG